MSVKRVLPMATMLTVLACGCSQPSAAPSAKKDGPLPASQPTTLASAVPVPPGQVAKPAEKKDVKPAEEKSSGEFVAPFPDNDNFFSPPKIEEPVVPEEKEEPKPEVVQPAPKVEEKKPEEPPPPVRLVGFMNVEGPRALLSIGSHLKAMAVGDSAQGVSVVAVDPPNVMLKHNEKEFQVNLLKQPWTTRSSTSGSVFGSRTSGATVPVSRVGPETNRMLPGLGRGSGATMPQLPPLPSVGPDGVDGLKSPPPPGGESLPGLPGTAGESAPPRSSAKSSNSGFGKGSASSKTSGSGTGKSKSADKRKSGKKSSADEEEDSDRLLHRPPALPGIPTIP